MATISDFTSSLDIDRKTEEPVIEVMENPIDLLTYKRGIVIDETSSDDVSDTSLTTVTEDGKTNPGHSLGKRGSVPS